MFWKGDLEARRVGEFLGPLIAPETLIGIGVDLDRPGVYSVSGVNTVAISATDLESAMPGYGETRFWIRLAVPQEEYDAIEEAAAASGTSKAEYARQGVLDAVARNFRATRPARTAKGIPPARERQQEDSTAAGSGTKKPGRKAKM